MYATVCLRCWAEQSTLTAAVDAADGENTMGYEIDFLPVGKEKSGDAILVRYGNLFGTRAEQKVIVVDAGYPETSDLVVKHLADHYNTDKIDLMISTHPDQDHIGGLEAVMNKCAV